MKWTLDQPNYGDIIRVKSGSIYHYGIYVNDNEVIQFGVAPSMRLNVKDCDIEVCVTDIDSFINGAFLEVAELDKKESKKRRSAEKSVEIARGRIGEKGYNILHNNCEHFVHECVFGEKYSSQTANIRDMFRSIPIVDLYIAQLPESEMYGNLIPEQRNSDVRATTHPLTKRQRYYAWKLLEYAIDRSFGYKIRNVEFTKQNSGKWLANKFCFSLSHSKNAIAVAVSRNAIGVDIEVIAPPRVDGVASRILDDYELERYKGLSSHEKAEYLIQRWTVKESIFKMGDNDVFAPKSITDDHNTATTRVSFSGDDYMVTVASDNIGRLRTFTVDGAKFN